MNNYYTCNGTHVDRDVRPQSSVVNSLTSLVMALIVTAVLALPVVVVVLH